MKINLAALDALDEQYSQHCADQMEGVSLKMVDHLEAKSQRLHDAILLVKYYAQFLDMAITDEGPDPLGEALNSGDGSYRP